jgi:predicted RNase H-like nuclease (RuvC/YqgF family)
MNEIGKYFAERDGDTMTNKLRDEAERIQKKIAELEAENKALQYKIDDLEENFNVIKHIDTRYKAQDKEISALRAEVKMLREALAPVAEAIRYTSGSLYSSPLKWKLVPRGMSYIEAMGALKLMSDELSGRCRKGWEDRRKEPS